MTPEPFSWVCHVLRVPLLVLKGKPKGQPLVFVGPLNTDPPKCRQKVMVSF